MRPCIEEIKGVCVINGISDKVVICTDIMKVTSVLANLIQRFQPTERCTPNPCNNGGTCVSTDEGFKCVCKPQYAGQLCETGGEPTS